MFYLKVLSYYAMNIVLKRNVTKRVSVVLKNIAWNYIYIYVYMYIKLM